MQVTPFPRATRRPTPTPVSASRDALDSGATVRIESFEYPDYPAIAKLYCQFVVDRKVDACRYIILACQRYLDMLDPAFQAKHGFYFSDEAAIEVCAFLETLTHVKGTKARETLVLDPYQIWIECAIHGFRWQGDGIRVVNTVYAELPRKHGKSFIAAGNGWYETTVLANQGDDLFIIAPKFEQGLKVLEPMQKMARDNPALSAFYRIKSTQKNSRVERTDSNIIVLASLGEKEDGHDPKTVIADEFHALGPEIYKVMKSAQRARPESMFWQMGSAGRHTFGPGWEERRNAIEVLEGKREAFELFAVIYTVDKGDEREWFSERVIRKANPGIGSSVDLRKTMQEARDARTSPTKKVEFLRTALNLWGFSETQLFPKENWEKCARPHLTIEHMRGKRGFIGLDLAARNDAVAMTAVFEEPLSEVEQMGDAIVQAVDLYVFAWHYVPEKGPWLQDDDLIGVYQEWHEKGYLTFTPGSMHDFAIMRKHLFWLNENFEIAMNVIDDFQANELYSAMIAKKLPVQSFRKNASNFTDPTKDIMARTEGEIIGLYHSGNPVLAWNMQNVIGGPDTADRILGKKPTPNSNQKIDGFDALIMANAARLQMMRAPEIRQSASVVRGMRRL